MSTLAQEAVKIDVELFDLIALSNQDRIRNRKDLLKRLHKFIMNTDLISGCMLVVAMQPEVLSDLVEYNDDIVEHVVRFTKTHTIPSVYDMLAVRYKRDLHRLELRLGAKKYSDIVYFFKGESNGN